MRQGSPARNIVQRESIQVGEILHGEFMHNDRSGLQLTFGAQGIVLPGHQVLLQTRQGSVYEGILYKTSYAMAALRECRVRLGQGQKSAESELVILDIHAFVSCRRIRTRQVELPREIRQYRSGSRRGRPEL